MALRDIDVEFYIHGVTTSFSYWGTSEEDANYLKTFYGGIEKDDNARMIVKYQKMNDGSYRTYYNYIIDANVKNSESRANSYIGMTISLKQSFCKNVRAIYQLLEYTFNIHIVGTILNRFGNSWKYSIPDFRSDEADTKKIREVVLTSIKSLINSCIDIAGVNNNGCPKLNLYSYDENGFVEQIKEFGQFIVNPFYESLAEKQTKANCDKTVAEGKEIWEKEKSQLQHNNQREKEEKAKLNSELEEMKNKFDNATAENKRLKNENQKYKDTKRMEEILQSREFKDLADLLRSYAPPRVHTEISNLPELPHKKESKKIVYTLSAGCVIFLVISGILGWQLYDAYDMLAKENDQNKRISSELSTARTTNEKLRSSTNFRKTGTDYSIDIAGSSAPLKANTTYTLKALNSNGNGFWQVIGANVETKNLDKQSVTIIPKEKGQITVRYFIDNEYFERNIKVE